MTKINIYLSLKNRQPTKELLNPPKQTSHSIEKGVEVSWLYGMY